MADTYASIAADDSSMALASVYNCFANALIDAAPSALIAYFAISSPSLNYVAIVINRPAIARNTTINMRPESEGVLTIAVNACPVTNLICLTATHDGNRFIVGHREKDFVAKSIFIQEKVD